MSKEAMKLALEALEDVQYYGWGQTERDYDARTAAITALREALDASLAQQDIQRLIALVRAQQITIDKLEAQRKPLTDEELYKVFPAIATYHEANKTLYRSIARAIEAAHGIEENT